jgi:hypothetical protein
MEGRARGGAAVGALSDLGAIEAGTVLCLRLWSDGPEGQQQVWTQFAAALGPQDGRVALKGFETLYRLCVTHGRRPLMRRCVGCSSVGADEACFAAFVAAACEGEREDALMIAMLLVRPDIAPGLVASAGALGLALKRLDLAARRTRPASSTLH